jgi:hypothetical protein
MRASAAVLAAVLLAGCAQLAPHREAPLDLAQFVAYAADPRVRHEPGAGEFAERVAALLPAAIAQVEAGHYRAFPAPVTIHVCGSDECFARHVPGAARLTAAVVYDNRLVLAPRLFDREPQRLYPILVHELSHLHLGQQLGHYTMRIPVWFHEGLASLIASGGGADLVSEDEALHAVGAGEHFLPEAAHDESMRRDADDSRLRITMFYRQSMMFLAHLRSLGEGEFRKLLLVLQDREPFDRAFATVFGASALQLALEFFDRLRCRQGACAAPAGAP